MIQNKLIFALIIFFLLIFTGCSSEKGSLPDDEFAIDYSLERINGLLENGENLKAIPLIISRERESNDTGDLYSRAVEGLLSEWEASVADGSWKPSLVYLRSFRTLLMFQKDMEISPDILEKVQKITRDNTEQQLFLKGVDNYIESGELAAAAALIQTDINIDNIDSKKRLELAEDFKKAGLSTVAAELGDSENTEAPAIGSLIDGTVTVWVNRGIKLVGSVGVPDRGLGSGFFIDKSGYLLTNYHVIESEVDPTYQGYSHLYIKTDDQSTDRFPAKVVGWDKNIDLALIKTEMDVPYVFSFATSDKPELGERVKAIGSPGGLTRTLTSGTVSAYARSIQPIVGSLQIDVPINPGNSGGPLLNEHGEVIGVVFAGVPNYEGINFAIPGPYVKRLIPSLFDGGAVQLSWIGLSAWDMGAGKIQVTYVVPGTPASDAGLKAGDIIKTVDGKKFSAIRAVQEYLLSRSPGTLTRIEWERGGTLMDGIVALGVRPDIPLETALSRDAREHLLTPLFGFEMERINGSGINQTYRVNSVLPGSIADEVGFSEGDTINLRKWIHDEEHHVVAIQLIYKGRKAGFLETAIQVASYLDVNTVF